MTAYLVLYGGILIWSEGLPFVSDNNESFSSLWHSFSMYQFGFGLNAGLTDEVFSPNLAAHPYVHTHQGNFPRLFGFLLYAVGLHTIESHIVVTALTIGVVVIFFLYHFLYQVAGIRFAVVTTLVFLTDYVLFAQWHLVTYRVWHGFFLFAQPPVRNGRPRVCTSVALAPPDRSDLHRAVLLRVDLRGVRVALLGVLRGGFRMAAALARDRVWDRTAGRRLDRSRRPPPPVGRLSGLGRPPGRPLLYLPCAQLRG